MSDLCCDDPLCEYRLEVEDLRTEIHRLMIEYDRLREALRLVGEGEAS